VPTTNTGLPFLRTMWASWNSTADLPGRWRSPSPVTNPNKLGAPGFVVKSSISMTTSGRNRWRHRVDFAEVRLMDDFTTETRRANLFGWYRKGERHRARPSGVEFHDAHHRPQEWQARVGGGHPGRIRIIHHRAGILVNIIDHGLSLQEAIDAPRIHHQWRPDTLAAEPFALSADTITALARMGYPRSALGSLGAGNAAEAVGVAPADPSLRSRSGFRGPACCTAPAIPALRPGQQCRRGRADLSAKSRSLF